MNLYLKLSILFILLSTSLFSFEYLIDTIGIPKTYQRTVYPNIPQKTTATATESGLDNVNGNLSKVKLWDNTERLISKPFISLSYIKRNGKLESLLIGESINYSEEIVNGFELGADFYESRIFLDTTNKSNMMYFNNFNFSQGILLHNYDNASNSKLEYMNLSTSFAYSRGYGWTFDEKSSVSLYKSLGISFENYYLSTTSTSKFAFGDFFESGVRYQSGKNFALTIGYKENISYFDLPFENWVLIKAAEIGGNAALDKFITPMLVNKRYNYTPIYQFIYQSAWSYLVNSLISPKNSKTSSTSEFAISDRRIVFGMKVYVNDMFSR